MRKFLATLLSAVLLLTLSACVKKNEAPQNTTNSTNDSTTATVEGTTIADTQQQITTTEQTTTTAKESTTATTSPKTTTVKQTATTKESATAATTTTTSATITTTTTTATTTTTKATTTTTKPILFKEVSYYSWKCEKLTGNELFSWSVVPSQKIVGMSGSMKASAMFATQAEFDEAYQNDTESFFQYGGEWFYAGMGDVGDLESITQSGNTVTVKIDGDAGTLMLTRESDKQMKVVSNTTNFYEVVAGDMFVAQ